MEEERNSYFVQLDDIDFEELIPQTAGNDIKRKLGFLLGAEPEATYSRNRKLEPILTLRRLNAEYGKQGGCKYEGREFEEFDRCETRGCVAPLKAFTNVVGHFAPLYRNNEPTHPLTLCFSPEILGDISSVALSVAAELAPSIRQGRLWSPWNCFECSRGADGYWNFSSRRLSREISVELDKLSVSFSAPISAHSRHAWLESEDLKDETRNLGIYGSPEETTAVTGLEGTHHNNQTIDMSPYEPEGVAVMKERLKNLDVPTFLCKLHTSHSSEAGRVRKLCCNVDVRVIGRRMIDRMVRACSIASKYEEGEKDWILFCMGKMCFCSYPSLRKLSTTITSLSSGTLQSCTLEVNIYTKCAILSVSSGVLVRKDPKNKPYTTTTLYSNGWPEEELDITFASPDDKDFMSYYFSAFAILVPFICQDRPPRTVIASVQSQQAVVVPYGAGTSSVAPTHVSHPLVSTPYLEEILNDPSAGICDYAPGTDLCVCYHNDNDTIEDAIIFSSSSGARGLYNYLAYTSHTLGAEEKIPEPGGRVNIVTNPWWKSYSRRNVSVEGYAKKLGSEFRNFSNKHKGDSKSDADTVLEEDKSTKGCKKLLSDGTKEGEIISKDVTQSGDISTKSLKFSYPASGDKLGSAHGQKGVITLRSGEDMLWGIDERGNPIHFDIIISLSSVVNRQTNGHYYEMVAAVEALRTGKRVVVDAFDECNSHTETELYDGRTGDILTRIDDDGDEVPVMASWGFSRVRQMTQLTEDKQHYTHKTAGPYAMSAPSRRSAGGGPKYGEMERLGGDAGGFKRMPEEITSRMSLIDVDICKRCKTILQVCMCHEEREIVKASIPHSTLVFIYAIILLYNITLEMEISY